jgi:hypothetical protein
LKSTNLKQIVARNGWLLLFLFVSLLGALLVGHHTRFGPGTNGDSIRYIMGAENLLAGNGYSRISGGGEIRPITGFPPVFSIILAGLGYLTGDVFNAARFLLCLLFAANIFLVALLLFRYTGSIWPSLIGTILVISAQEVLWLHTWVLTEALFIFLMLLAFYLLTAYLDSNNLSFLLLASVLIGSATLTRYIGVALTAAGGLSILILSKKSWKRRLVDGMVLGVGTLLPLILWFYRNAAISDNVSNRVISYSPIPTKVLRIYIADVLSWFAPRIMDLPRPIRNMLVAILALPLPAVFFFRELKASLSKVKKEGQAFWTLPWILTLFMIFYVVILVLNSAFLDPALTPQGQLRYLVPLFVTTVVLFSLMAHRALKGIKFISPYRILILAVSVLLIILYALESWIYLRDPLMNIGYTGLRTLWPDTVEAIQSLDPETIIVANNPEMAYALAGRPAYMMPILQDASTGDTREDFDQQIEATREKLEKGGVLFIFGAMSTHDREVIERLEAEPVGVFFDSAMFGYPEAAE